MQWQRFTSYILGRAAGTEFRRSHNYFLLIFNGIYLVPVMDLL